MTRNLYEYKHQLDFIESGVLSDDIYMVVKLELSEFLKDKYKIYLNAFCEEDNLQIAKFYSEYYQLLNRLSIICKNREIRSLKEYSYSLSSPISSKSSEINTLLTTLREIDILIFSFIYDIINSVKNNNSKYSLEKGVYAVINQYFKVCENKKFDDFSGLLSSLYDITYRAMRLKYKENKYGKK